MKAANRLASHKSYPRDKVAGAADPAPRHKGRRRAWHQALKQPYASLLGLRRPAAQLFELKQPLQIALDGDGKIAYSNIFGQTTLARLVRRYPAHQPTCPSPRKGSQRRCLRVTSYLSGNAAAPGTLRFGRTALICRR